MKNIYFLLLILVFSTKSNAQTPELFFEQSNEFFKKYVSIDGKIDYTSLKKSPGELIYILNNITKIDAKFSDANKAKAFWINVYNLEVIRSVLDNFPVASVEKIPGFFNENTFMVAKQELTLDDVENTILREIFSDPCIHFVLSSASTGGAPLLNAAYLPETIDEQMLQQAKKYINNPAVFRYDKKTKTIEIPKIFEWYKKDFVTYYKNEIDFLNIFLDKKLSHDLIIKIYDFDWSLNNKI